MFRGTPINYEPKKLNRFQLLFPSELGIESWLVMTAGLPKININTVEIDYFDQKTHVTGKVTFEQITITLLDHIGPSSTQKIMEWIRLHHEILTNRSGYAVGYKKTLTLQTFDPTNVAIEEWKLFDCQITNVDFGDFDYANDDVKKVTFTIQPDRVETPY